MTAEHHRGLRCSAERHIWRLGALPLAIYVKLTALTYGKGNRYFSSKLNLQEFFGASEKGIYDAFRDLERTGWLTRETSLVEAGVYTARASTFRPKNYLLVTHDEWVLTHDAAACAQPDVMPWDADQKENEQLVKQLYAASDGGRWYREMIVSLRQTGRQRS